MILVLNTCFEGYTPVKVLGKSSLYREVYLAKDQCDSEVFLIVYDMNKLPQCYADGKLPLITGHRQGKSHGHILKIHLFGYLAECVLAALVFKNHLARREK
jgi:hypothetical protein